MTDDARALLDAWRAWEAAPRDPATAAGAAYETAAAELAGRYHLEPGVLRALLAWARRHHYDRDDALDTILRLCKEIAA